MNRHVIEVQFGGTAPASTRIASFGNAASDVMPRGGPKP